MTWNLAPKSRITWAENVSTCNFNGLCHDNFMHMVFSQNLAEAVKE